MRVITQYVICLFVGGRKVIEYVVLHSLSGSPNAVDAGVGTRPSFKPSSRRQVDLVSPLTAALS